MDDIREIARLYLEGASVLGAYGAPPLQIAHIYAWRNHRYELAIEAKNKRRAEAEERRAKKAEERKAARERLAANAWPMEKQRRSRINWADLLPAEVVRHQERWERLTTIIRMKEVGLTYREIGERLGLSVERTRQLYCQGQRFRRHPAARKYGSPAERFMYDGFTFNGLRPRGKLIALRYLEELADMNRHGSKRDWLFVSSR